MKQTPVSLSIHDTPPSRRTLRVAGAKRFTAKSSRSARGCSFLRSTGLTRCFKREQRLVLELERKSQTTSDAQYDLVGAAWLGAYLADRSDGVQYPQLCSATGHISMLRVNVIFRRPRNIRLSCNDDYVLHSQIQLMPGLLPIHEVLYNSRKFDSKHKLVYLRSEFDTKIKKRHH